MHGKAFFDLRLTDLTARPAPESESPSHEHGLRAVFIKGNDNIVVQYFLYLHSIFLSCGADRIQSLACSAHCAFVAPPELKFIHSGRAIGTASRRNSMPLGTTAFADR